MNPRRVCRQRRNETRKAPATRTAPKGTTPAARVVEGVPTLRVDPGQLAVWAWEDFCWAQERAEDEARRVERAQFLTAVNGWPPAQPERYDRWAPRR